MTTETQLVSFDESATRREEMHSTIEAWLDDLQSLVDEATASREFQEWLDVQSRFHDYSHRNTLLIKQQCPDATRVAGYRTWQSEFDRHVTEGEQAIWIWAPIIAKQCPNCGNSSSYHKQSDCEYDETPPAEWSKGFVGFRPAPVFDVSQTEGEELPELDTAAEGDADALFPALREAASEIDVSVSVVGPDNWAYGEATGICRQAPGDDQPTIELLDQDDPAALAGVLIHEYAHALLHIGVDDQAEQSKREVEAEDVAYLVGRHFGLDTSGSAFYLAAWNDDETDTLLERLGRISRTATEIVDTAVY
ncbi:ArdC-like ssDNA-binding domain-containing protein [Natronoarchaeum philippinense]|nr:ArdC-like ssDNA-binding domain-containing protein [Natronoarchaeum philippinense]